MSKKEKYNITNDGITVGIRLSKDQAAHIKLLARKMAYEQNDRISFSSLVRDALDEVYPIKEKKKN